MKSENWIILEIGVVLAVLGALSFFHAPAYDKGAWYVIGVFSTAFGTVMGYKFGKSMPAQAGDQKPGQTSETTTKTDTAPPPPPAA